MKPICGFSGRKFAIVMAVVFIAGLVHAQTQPPSLGEVAARARKNRLLTTRRARVITNDDLVVAPTLRAYPASTPSRSARSSASESIEANTSDSSAAVTADSRTALATGSHSPDAQKSGSANSAVPDDDPLKRAEKLESAWSTKLADQRARVALLARDVDVSEREMRMRQAVYYSDAGARLRDPGAFDQANLKDHDEIQSKRDALSKANAELDALTEQARRAGVASRVYQ